MSFLVVAGLVWFYRYVMQSYFALAIKSLFLASLMGFHNLLLLCMVISNTMDDCVQLVTF